MAKKQQKPTAVAASKDDQPLTPAAKVDQPQPSKKPEEKKVEEHDDEDETSETASSSEGEEEDEEDEDDEEEEEEEKAPSSQPALKTTPTTTSQPKNDAEDGEETESDSDHEPPLKLKSLNSKSIDQTIKPKAQPKSSAPARSGTKRPADNETNQSKKKKTTDDKKEKEEDKKNSGDDSKKMFQRVFTEDDEIAILKGLADYIAEKKADPIRYAPAFYAHVKNSISFPVTLDQMRDKVRRLKLKFENKLNGSKKGKAPTFSKPIEEKMFELSRKVWGDEAVVLKPNGKPSKKELAVAAKKSPITKKLVMEPDSALVVSKETSGGGKENPGSRLILNEIERFQKSSVAALSVDEMKSGVELLEESRRVEFQSRLRKLRVAELEMYARRGKLVEDHTTLILDALKKLSSRH